MNMLVNALFILIAYLLGSIPFGYLFTKRATGKNILESGSGNIGSTNVERIAGKNISLLTQLCDMLKGLLPVAAILILQYNSIISLDKFLVYYVAFASIVGHDFSVFLKFKGGKGVNTTLGASILLTPFAVLISVLVYFLVKWRTNYVSLGSICLAISLPLISLLLQNLSLSFYYLLAASLLIIVMHIPNIRRLIQGTENRSK